MKEGKALRNQWGAEKENMDWVSTDMNEQWRKEVKMMLA